MGYTNKYMYSKIIFYLCQDGCSFALQENLQHESSNQPAVQAYAEDASVNVDPRSRAYWAQGAT